MSNIERYENLVLDASNVKREHNCDSIDRGGENLSRDVATPLRAA
jgi:hypothetical protein